MTGAPDDVEAALRYVQHSLTGQQNLSPNERRMIALAQEVARLRSEVRTYQRTLRSHSK